MKQNEQQKTIDDIMRAGMQIIPVKQEMIDDAVVRVRSRIAAASMAPISQKSIWQGTFAVPALGMAALAVAAGVWFVAGQRPQTSLAIDSVGIDSLCALVARATTPGQNDPRDLAMSAATLARMLDDTRTAALAAQVDVDERQRLNAVAEELELVIEGLVWASKELTES